MMRSSLTPDALLPKWPALHHAGVVSFVVRYGIARFSIILMGGFFGARLFAGVPAMSAMRQLLVALVFVMTGVAWALTVWNICERRARSAALNESGINDVASNGSAGSPS